MSGKEAIKEAIQTTGDALGTSLTQAQGTHAVAFTAMGAGVITGSTIVQFLAGIASIVIIIKTVLDIRLSMIKIKKEKQE